MAALIITTLVAVPLMIAAQAGGTQNVNLIETTSEAEAVTGTDSSTEITSVASITSPESELGATTIDADTQARSLLSDADGSELLVAGARDTPLEPGTALEPGTGLEPGPTGRAPSPSSGSSDNESLSADAGPPLTAAASARPSERNRPSSTTELLIAAPTTFPASSAAPTTVAPTTVAPTTVAPTTVAPVAATVATPAPDQAPAPAVADSAPANAAPPETAPPTTEPNSEHWANLRHCESGGNYGVVSPNGKYFGAYQFNLSTWDSLAGSIGRPDLAGVRPNEAVPTDQDAMAQALWRQRGNQPWPQCGIHVPPKP